jgi:ribose/xylose/arabinose/galactoside ABC-type transport system permease subunit
MSMASASARNSPAAALIAALSRNDVYVILVVLAVGASLVTPAFRSPDNISNLLTQSALLGIISVGQFAVVVTGGFDLSVAAVMALASVVLARTTGSVGIGPAALLAILVGTGCGLFNGLVVTWGRVQPLIATLAMMGIARGLAFSISEKSILVNDPVLAALRGFDWPLSVPTLVWLVVVVAAALWFRATRQALHVYAVGGNEQTARLAGVPADRVKIGVFTASGFLSGLAGIVLVIRSSSGVPLGGIGWELDSIASIVIGGTNLFGGEGRLLHAMAGVLIYQMIANMMNLAGVDPFYQDILRAAVIILAVGLSILRQRAASRRMILGRT